MPLKLRWLALLCLAFLISARSIGFDYSLDDTAHLNQAELNYQLPNLLFSTSTWPGNLYRPFFSATLVGGLAIHGDNPAGFHLLNCILYGLTIVSCYFLGRKLFNEDIAFLSSTIFCVIPIHSEVVGSIAFRTELLAAFFVVTSLNLLLKSNISKVRMLLALVAIILGFLSKESSLTLLPLYLLCTNHLGWSFKETWVGLKLTLLGLIGYFAMRYNAIGTFLGGGFDSISYLDNPLVESEFLSRSSAALALLGKYVAQTIAPHDLSIDYSHAKLASFYPSTGPASMSFEAKFYLLTLLSLLFVGVANRNSSSRIGALWFLIAFSITCNIFVPIGTIFANRLAFLPSLGICWVIAGAVLKLKEPKTIALVSTIVVLTYSARFYIELDKWEDSVTIGVSELESSPNSARVNFIYAVLLSKKGEFEKARMHLDKALQIYPEYSNAWLQKGKIALKEKKPKLAKRHLKRAYQKDHKSQEALIDLGRIYLEEGKLDLAGLLFTNALNLNNYNQNAIVGLIKVFTKKGNTKQANKFKNLLTGIRGQTAVK